MQSYKFTSQYVQSKGIQLVNLPVTPCESANYKIKNVLHKKGTVVDVMSPRMAILTGVGRMRHKLNEDWNCLQLIEKGAGTWMSTHPIEMFSHVVPALTAHGDVLIGGLGLGLVLELLKENKKVKSITVVEHSQELIHLVGKYYPEVYIVHADINDFLINIQKKYDYIYLDTWTEDSEYEFYHTVLPLRYYARQRLKSTSSIDTPSDLQCWMEEVMRGQVITGIMGRLLVANEVTMALNNPVVELQWQRSSPISWSFFNEYSLKWLQADQTRLIGLIPKFVRTYEY